MNKRLSVFAALLAADQITKYLAASNLPAAAGPPRFLSLALRYNYGISFSLSSESPRAAMTLAAVSVVALLVVCAASRVLRSSLGVMFLWGGAVGNLIDRLIHGRVTDWLYAGVYLNAADLWLCTGFILVLHDAARPVR
ncbi:MAG: signal peptidase II [Synergistaceae bacterium]|jgi:signal peptidase II|nr:signal peptidase II [Synergistaceae bacterium]